MSFTNEKILIETYRDWDIWYKPENEEFLAENGANESQNRKTLSAARKFVDEFRKANAEFKPFAVVGIDRYRKDKPLTIVGMRKDARFIAENAKGEKEQISEYNERDYAIPNPENEPILDKIKELEAKKRKIQHRIEEQQVLLKWETLADIKRAQDWADWTNRTTK
jgi:hypothetical protein